MMKRKRRDSPINAVVHGYHDDARNPEADRTRDDGVRLIHYEHATLRVLRHPLEVVVGGVPAQENGREGDEGRQQPHVGQHEAHRAHRHVQRVLQGSNYGVIPAGEEERKRG